MEEQGVEEAQRARCGAWERGAVTIPAAGQLRRRCAGEAATAMLPNAHTYIYLLFHRRCRHFQGQSDDPGDSLTLCTLGL